MIYDTNKIWINLSNCTRNTRNNIVTVCYILFRKTIVVLQMQPNSKNIFYTAKLFSCIFYVIFFPKTTVLFG